MQERSSIIAASALALMPAIEARWQSGELAPYCKVGEEVCRVISEAFSHETAGGIVFRHDAVGSCPARRRDLSRQPHGI